MGGYLLFKVIEEGSILVEKTTLMINQTLTNNEEVRLYFQILIDGAQRSFVEIVDNRLKDLAPTKNISISSIYNKVKNFRN